MMAYDVAVIGGGFCDLGRIRARPRNCHHIEGCRRFLTGISSSVDFRTWVGTW